MDSQRMAAKTFGVFFIVAFLSYGLGTGLVASISNAPDFLFSLQENKIQYVFGIILMALIHSFVNIGLAVTAFPLLKPHGERLSYGYVSAAITATTVLVIGAISLLCLIPLSDAYVSGASANAAQYELTATILKQGGFYGYQIGMAIWGMGGLMFCTLLYKSKLVPRVFSIWGLVGYTVFMAGTIAELYGMPIGVQLALPGGLFELALSLWLIVKGFHYSNETFDSRSAVAQ